MSSLKKFDYRIKDNRKRNIFLCGIILVVVTIVGVKLFNSYATFSNETTTIDLANGSVIIPATHYLKELEKTNKDELMYDGTIDNNLRYIGANPNNYIDIENGEYQTDIWIGYNNDDIYQAQRPVEYQSLEACQKDKTYNKHCTKLHSKGDPILWRIIGVMNNIDDGTGKIESRLKIIRDEDIGMMAWDAKCNGTIDENGVCSGENTYSNNWNEASLKETLNEAFWNSTSTSTKKYIYEYDNANSKYISKWEQLNFSKEGMNEESKKLFENAKWHLGGITSTEYSTATAEIYYTKEHSDKVYGTNPTSTNAIVGLMYASDYGFAIGGGATTRETCLKTALYNWGPKQVSQSQSELLICREYDWLYKPSNYQWVITPLASNDNLASSVNYSGFVRYQTHVINEYYRVHPVLYLKSTVKITEGKGTKEEPFKISL